jgi:hypothetical protein
MVAKSLEEAFQKASKLSEDEQEILAQLILDEIQEFESPPTSSKPKRTLDEMINRANRDYDEGHTEPLDPHNL